MEPSPCEPSFVPNPIHDSIPLHPEKPPFAIVPGRRATPVVQFMLPRACGVNQSVPVSAT